ITRQHGFPTHRPSRVGGIGRPGSSPLVVAIVVPVVRSRLRCRWRQLTPLPDAPHFFSIHAPAGYHVAMLQDRVALISGAATGIGEAVARLFASQGAHTYLFDR